MRISEVEGDSVASRDSRTRRNGVRRPGGVEYGNVEFHFQPGADGDRILIFKETGDGICQLSIALTFSGEDAGGTPALAVDYR